VTVVGRSPGQLAWMRLRRDRVAVTSAWVLAVFGVIVLAAPLIQWLYGDDPQKGHSELLDSIGYPLGTAGGISADHWLGLTPQVGYDLFLNLIFGARTSLGIALTSAVLAVAIGVLVGVVSGYMGGWVDRVLVWFTDFMLAFPFFLFAIALVPTLQTRLADQFGEVAVWKKVAVIIGIFILFSWMSMARIVRGQVISLREREYVEAARAAGAGTGHILFRQLLPNIWAPVLVVFSLLVPALVTAEAALSFLNIGIQEPTPDLGRLILTGARNVTNTGLIPGAVFLPALLIFILVLAFNLLGDAVRDALDPRSSK
jgi:peptide/nickel transport system permease protein